MKKKTSEFRRHTVEMYASAARVHLVLLWPRPLTLKTFSAKPTYMMNICVMFTTDVGIRKLKSDLFLHAIITGSNHCLLEVDASLW